MTALALHVPPELLTRYAIAAPRYTSYPTAVDWKNDVDAAAYPEHQARSAQSEPRCSVYFHIPFCEERCLFCGCNVFITHDHSRGDVYVSHLEKELAAARAAQGRTRPVVQYHWGGGTPTYLDERQIRRLQDAFLGAFTLEPDAEVAIEVDPRVTSDAQLRLLAGLGFNRVSLGIQDFDAKVQEAVKRVQSYEETRRVIETSREAGIRSINVDLIYGLPYQTIAGFQKSVDLVLGLRPERVALFHYAHVPWLKKHQTALDLEAAPSPELKIAIFTAAVAAFTAAGYDYVGLDHFALPSDEMARARRDRTLQRNFMGYSTRAGFDLLAFGTSAIGEVDGAFFQNVPVLKEWQDGVQARGFAIAKSHRLAAEDRLRRHLIMNLMCHGTVVKREIESAHGIDFDAHFATELAELRPLAADGLVELRKDALVLTRLGQVFMRNVAVAFDLYFRERHAQAGAPTKTFSRTL